MDNSKKIELEQEKKYFDFVKNFSQENVDKIMETYDDLKFRYLKHPDSYRVQFESTDHKLKIFSNGIEKPYFARIDFDDLDNDKHHKMYIGKYSIMDEDLNAYVIDWRAPVSNLYYESDIGKSSYESPQGIVNVDLLLKRQFDIENGELNDFYDVDLVSNDTLLQKYLNENNDARIKNIVSTIQKEQNIAIRQPLNKNIIVQGVAGSGKTTIALHRIAYLVYQYRHNIKNSQYLVIGPNDVFLKYIKGVLPDLDVENINEKTYEMFTKNVINEPDLIIKSSSKKQIEYITGKVQDDIPKFKNSLKYKEMINSFINQYFDSISNNDLVINGFSILDSKTIKSILQTAIEDSNDFDKAIDRFVLLGSYYVEKNKDDVLYNFSIQSKEYFDKNKDKDINKCRRIIKETKDEIEKYCKSSLRKYINKYKTTSIKLYKKFINEIEKYDIYNYEFISKLKKETLDNLKRNEIDFEDLAALLYIKSRLGVDEECKKYRHVVVDEAQDLGEFNYYSLKQCLPNATFSIYGDIAQSIYSYRSIDSWNDVINIINDCEVLEFNKSYRTTDEIMTVANEISKELNIAPAELSVRHGENVQFSKVDKDNLVSSIKEKVEKYKEDGYKTIAVISKYPLQTSYLNDDLSFEGLFIPEIRENTDITAQGNEIVNISNTLAKGLEFDAVIIHNADEEIYNSNNTSDMKLLYVALTRALHKLDVVYTDKICAPLQKFVEKEKVLKKV